MDRKIVYFSVAVAMAALLLVFAFLPCVSLKCTNSLGNQVDTKVSGLDAMRAYFTAGDSQAKRDLAQDIFANDPNNAYAAIVDQQGMLLDLIESETTATSPDFERLNKLSSYITMIAMAALLLLLFGLVSLILGIVALVGSRAPLLHIFYICSAVIAGVVGLGVTLIATVAAATIEGVGIQAWSIIVGVLGLAYAISPFIAMKFKACVLKESLKS